MTRTHTTTPQAFSLSAAVFAAVLMFTVSAQAVDYTWDPTSGDGVVTEGTGTWDTTTTNWTTDVGVTNVAAPSGAFTSDLIFGGGTLGTAGTVTLATTGNDYGSIEFLATNAGTYDIDLNGNDVRLRRSASTIRVGEDATISDGAGGGALNFAGDTDIRFTDSSKTLSISAVVGDTGGAGTISVNLGGTVDLSGVNTFTQNITLANQSQLIVSGTGQLGSGSYAGNITMNQGTDFTFSSSADQILSGIISDDGTGNGNNDVNMSGSGTLTLTGTNTYTGRTFINSGTVEIGGSGTLGSGSYAGLITNNGTLEYTSDQAQTLSDNITGTGALVKDGSSSVLTLSGNNGYSGTTTIDQGTVQAGSTNALSTASDFTVNSGGILQLNGFDNTIDTLAGTAGGIVENGGAADAELTVGDSAGPTTFDGVIQDGSGGGTLSLNVRDGGSSGLTLTGVNTFTGDIIARNQAQLIIEGAGQLGGGNYAGNITLNQNGQFEYASSADQILSGVIDDDASEADGQPNDVIMSGSGTLTLTGNSTYEGPTTVSDGTLLINGDNSSAIGDVNVTGGTLGGTGIIGGATTVNAGGNLSAGDGGIGTLTFNQTVDVSGATAAAGLLFDLGASGVGDTISMTGSELDIGTFDLNSFTFTNAGYSTVRGDFTWTLFDTGSLAGGSGLGGVLDDISFFEGIKAVELQLNGTAIELFMTVPEPSSAALLGLGLSSLLLRRKRG